MGRECDGGGNRYASNVTVRGNEELTSFFGQREKVPAGVCSIQLNPGTSPWIVCPRRLLVLGREAAGERVFQRQTEEQVLRFLDYVPGTRLGVWPEMKLKYLEVVEGVTKSFDYTFDYILMPLTRMSSTEVERKLLVPRNQLLTWFKRGGYTLTSDGDELYIENCPSGSPSIIEIMTSSTSGGNKSKGTTIPAAFNDAILGHPHNAPGINYRQIWARMVSQLIVKSEVAIGWNGKAVWIVQDVLVDYISRSTALNIREFFSEHTSDVNLLSFSYSDAFKNQVGVIELAEGQLFSGPISANGTDQSETVFSFQDIVRTPSKPSIGRLMQIVAQRKPVNEVIVP
jgi:hypothetical protein